MEISAFDCYKILEKNLTPEALKRLRSLCRSPSLSPERLLQEFLAEKEMLRIPEKVKDVFARGLAVMREMEMGRN